MGKLMLLLNLIVPRAWNREAWLVGENLREKIDEDPELGGQPSATGTDRADRKRRRFIITEHETHGVRGDLAREQPAWRVRQTKIGQHRFANLICVVGAEAASRLIVDVAELAAKAPCTRRSERRVNDALVSLEFARARRLALLFEIGRAGDRHDPGSGDLPVGPRFGFQFA